MMKSSMLVCVICSIIIQLEMVHGCSVRLFMSSVYSCRACSWCPPWYDTLDTPDQKNVYLASLLSPTSANCISAHDATSTLSCSSSLATGVDLQLGSFLLSNSILTFQHANESLSPHFLTCVFFLLSCIHPTISRVLLTVGSQPGSNWMSLFYHTFYKGIL